MHTDISVHLANGHVKSTCVLISLCYDMSRVVFGMSGKTSTQSKTKYNENAYAQYIFRVRKRSELNEAINEFKSQKGTSLNYLITKLLCTHFDVLIPIPEMDGTDE